MARIDVLPSIEIIRGFKGILDFYLWRGLPCVRAWPRYRPAKQTAASLAAALTFGAIVKAYSRMGEIALQAYRDDAADQPRTARDIYVTSQYGHLHEATMSDFLDAIIIIRDAVVGLTDLLHALDSVGTDEIDVNVEHSVLPTSASTLAEQQTQTTALAKIDDLQDALESVALDRLLVRGMDQLFTYKWALHDRKSGNPSGANGYLDSSAVPAGEIWHVSHISVVDTTRALTALHYQFRTATFDRVIKWDVQAIATGVWMSTDCDVWLDATDWIRVWLIGSQAGDTVLLDLIGHAMTLET